MPVSVAISAPATGLRHAEHVKRRARRAQCELQPNTRRRRVSRAPRCRSTRIASITASVIKPEEVIVTPVPSMPLQHRDGAVRARRRGDTHGPFWPSIGDQIKLADATRDRADAPGGCFSNQGRPRPSTRFTPRTKAIIVNSPCNPTGALIIESKWPSLLTPPRPAASWVIVDFTYERLIYERRRTT